jgi:hypothetical protein
MRSSFFKQGWSIEIGRERWLNGDDSPYEPLLSSGEEEGEHTNWHFLTATAALVVLHLVIQVRRPFFSSPCLTGRFSIILHA